MRTPSVEQRAADDLNEASLGTREKNKEQRKKDRKPRSGYEIGHTASPKRRAAGRTARAENKAKQIANDLYKAGMTQRGREKQKQKQKQNKDKAKR